MQHIRAALGHQHHLAAGGTALIRTLPTHGDAKLLHGIERDREHGVESGIDVGSVAVDALISASRGRVLRHETGILVIVHIHAVEGDVVLIAARSQYFAIGCDARLQAQEFDNVPRLQRQGAYLPLGKRISDRGIDGVDGGGFRGNADTLGVLAQRHLQIERRRRVDQQIDAGARNRSKAGLLRGDSVSPGSQLQELVFAGRAGH